MSNVSCPSCKKLQEINHDDGYGCEEDVDYEQHCTECGMLFKFTTCISFHYEVFCVGLHDMEQSLYFNTLWNCKNCDFYESREENQP